MGTPSGVNLTELRDVFLGLRGAGLGRLSAGREGAARGGDDSGTEGAGTTGAAGTAGAADIGGVFSIAAAEEGTDRAASRAIEPRNSHAAIATNATRAAIAASATPRPRRTVGFAPGVSAAGAGSDTETAAEVVRVAITCQGFG